VIEIKDDRGVEFEEAAGPAVMSVRGSLVVSHARIFESLWREAELTARLQETDRLQREFVNVAAHELKTPIQPILVTAYLLGADEPEGADEEEEIAVKRKYLTIIFRNAKRLQQLSSNILEVARLESQSFRLHRQRINIRDVIQEELRSARSKNSAVEWRYEPEDFFVDADEGRLAEVMANLLSNAARFTEKGMISVTAGRHGGEIVVQVADTGSGIHPEIMPRLFQKFASKSEADTGTGLGLFISKSIIEAHEGRIWAQNNRTGGSAFSFSLPVA
jgi:signal transduction histidine kinase